MQKSVINIICIVLLICAEESELQGRSPKSSELYTAGVASFREGDRENALKLFRESAGINNNYALAHYGIGRVYLMQQGKVNEAALHFKKAVEMDNSFAAAYFYLGMAEMFRGRYNDAISAFKKAYERDLTNHESLYNIAASYELAGDSINSHVFFRRYLMTREQKEEDLFPFPR